MPVVTDAANPCTEMVSRYAHRACAWTGSGSAVDGGSRPPAPSTKA